MCENVNVWGLHDYQRLFRGSPSPSWQDGLWSKWCSSRSRAESKCPQGIIGLLNSAFLDVNLTLALSEAAGQSPGYISCRTTRGSWPSLTLLVRRWPAITLEASLSATLGVSGLESI